ncbi:transcriptional activator FtrB [Roseibium album]|nr:transcriptional activator FtrB [Roseibium album]
MITIMFDWLSQLFSDAAPRSFERGRHLFHTDDAVSNVFLVLEGQIDLVLVTPSGNVITLQRASNGDVLAEASVNSNTYHCDAVARTESKVAQLGTVTFKDLLATNRTWSECWTASLARSVQQARLDTEVRSLKKVSDRLDFWLSIHSKNLDNQQVKDIAAEIGVSPEALYRELSKRREKGA